MSRSRNFIKGLASGYLMMAANILYTMGSIPLALHYLPKEEFGLWALVTQIAGYFSLLDIGMTSSVSRCLIDFKDDKSNEAYGSLVTTAAVVFAVQGAIVAICGILLGPLACHLVDAPEKYVGIFRLLLVFQCLVLSLVFCTKIFGAILFAHQQYVVSNVSAMTQLVVMFFGLWFGFHRGMGLYSTVLAGAVGFVLGTCLQITACVWLGLMPRPGCWGRPKMNLFRDLFAYGKDIFVFALGSQLVSASQVIIISRLMGLEAAATWAICTKAFVLAQQAVFRICDFSLGAFSEMYVRGEHERLRNRFRDAVILTAATGVLVCVVGAACNGPFLHLWTQGRISWNPFNDLLMGAMLVIISITRCHTAMFGIAKKVGMGRFVPLAEGCLFILSSLYAVPRWGFSGILVCAIVANVLLSGLCGLYRSRMLFGCSYSEMTLGWLRAPMKLSAGLALFAIPAVHLLKPLDYSTQLLVLVVLFVLIAPPLLWFLGLSVELRADMQRILFKIRRPQLSIR